MEQGTITRNYDSTLSGINANVTGVFPIFFREAVRNEVKSLEAGRPVFDMIEMVRIIIPGDNLSSPVRLVKESDQVNYADAYRRFKNEEEMVYDGTPVDAWPRLELKQVYALKAQNFFTVESIASCSDSNLAKLGLGGSLLRDMAKAYLEASKAGGAAERYVAENAKLRTDMESMTRTIGDLKQLIEKMAREKGTDVASVSAGLEAAVSHVQTDAVLGKGDLPKDWQTFKFKELLDLCRTLEFAATPRNREEAAALLSEYEGRRAALKR